MKKIILLVSCLLICGKAYTSTQFTPYEANPFEGRVGVIGQVQDERLRLDIGMTYDLFDVVDIGEGTLVLGTDWMVWTRLQSEGRFKFPVETSDYWFGFNLNYVTDDYGIRTRIAHISSHLVDGYTNRTTTQWDFLKTPFVYSREFVEVNGYYNIAENMRAYAGISLLFSTIPDGFEIVTPQLGLDYVFPLDDVIGISGFQLRSGFDIKFVDNLQEIVPTIAYQATLGYFSDNDRGISLGLYGYDGASMHGMFFMDRDSYLGMGFQVYFY